MSLIIFFQINLDTLVSTDAQEMFYSSKRQQYLIDQGYTFKIVTNLCDIANADALASGFLYATPEADRDLLRTVLNADDDMEKEQREEDTAIRKKNANGAGPVQTLYRNLKYFLRQRKF